MAILIDLEIGQAHLVGHDWGAALAWALASLTPGNVDHLSLVTRRYCSGLLNFAAHSPADSDNANRKFRSARLQRTGLKGLFRYRTAGVCGLRPSRHDHRV